MRTTHTQGLRRFGTVLTALCLTASLVPASALAEEGIGPQGADPQQFVAVVPNEQGQTTFDTLNGNSEKGGLAIIASDEGQSATVNGNIENAANIGVVDYAYGANTNVTITGDVDVAVKDQGPGGIVVSASNAEANLTAGNVNYTGNGEGNAVVANAAEGGTTNVTVGKIVASNAETAVMNLAGSGGTTNVQVAGIEARTQRRQL